MEYVFLAKHHHVRINVNLEPDVIVAIVYVENGVTID
jgi:hypothetical protein